MPPTTEKSTRIEIQDIYHIKAEVHSMKDLLERLSESIDKLTQASGNISQLLAVQISRLDNQEKLVDRFIRITEEKEKSLTNQIQTVEKDIYINMKEKDLKLSDEVKDIKNQLAGYNKKMNEKILQIERWIWMVSGGAAIVGFLANKLVTVLFKF